MRWLFVGLVAGVAATLGATALAGERASTATAFIDCQKHSGTVACTLRRTTTYDINIPALDLTCFVFPPGRHESGPFVSCQRASTLGECIDGISHSLTAIIERFRMYLSLPDRCVIDDTAIGGYRITKNRGTSRMYPRTP
jgi:hypothetical protein